MATSSIQDRTAEFRAVLAQAQKRQSSTRVGSQRQSLLTESQNQAANGSPIGDGKGSRKGARSEFARRAAEIGRGITSTMEKLGRLAECTLDSTSVPSSRTVILAGADVLSSKLEIATNNYTAL